MIAFETGQVGWLVSRNHDRSSASTWVTRDAGQHWTPMPLRGVTAVTATPARAYFVAHGELLETTTDPASVRVIAPASGDGLLVEHHTLIDYDHGAGERLTRHSVLTEVTGSQVLIEPMPCASARAFSAAVTATPVGDLIAACGAEPSMGMQLKSAYKTSDRGWTWTRYPAPRASGYLGDGAAGGSAGFIDGERMSLEATMSGTWRTSLTGSGNSGGLGAIGFSNARFGWVIDDGPPSALYLTDNAGRTWHHADPPT